MDFLDDAPLGVPEDERGSARSPRSSFLSRAPACGLPWSEVAVRLVTLVRTYPRIVLRPKLWRLVVAQLGGRRVRSALRGASTGASASLRAMDNACADCSFVRSTHKPLKVSFFGHFGTPNTGNESTLLAILSRLRALSPESEFRCICYQPRSCRRERRDRSGSDHDQGCQDLGSRRSLGQTGADGVRRGGRRASAVRPRVQEAQGNRHADRPGDGAGDRRVRPFCLGPIQPVQVGADGKAASLQSAVRQRRGGPDRPRRRANPRQGGLVSG